MTGVLIKLILQGKLLFRREIILAYTANRADPVFRQIIKRCSSLYTVIGIALCRIVDVATSIAYVPFHINLLDSRFPQTVNITVFSCIHSISFYTEICNRLVAGFQILKI